MQHQIKVLLVDDEDRFCETTSKLLIKKGFDTAIANNAEKAIHLLKDNKRDVIVLDIQMTGMDGHTALHEIKKSDPDIQVIILTGHGSRYSAMRALVREAFDYLAKPCDVDILASRIHDAYLAKHRGFKFDDKKALNLMIPLHELKSIPADMGLKEAMAMGEGFLAVMDERKMLAGILTRMDIIRSVRPEYISGEGTFNEQSSRFSSMFWSGFFSDRVKAVSQKKVWEILSDPQPTISENANLLEVAHMISGTTGGVLLVKDISKVIGIIRDEDIYSEIESLMKK
ncbi:MAG: response regulator [Desulfobacteraceae bacterium]|nr:response regulator [Desulfobacteraceae bacterium]